MSDSSTPTLAPPGPIDPTTSASELPNADELKARKAAGRKALQRFMGFVRWRLLIGRILGALAGILSVVYIIQFVALGTVVLDAHNTGQPIDGNRVNDIVRTLLMAFLGQLGAYGIALIITHFADLKLRGIIQDSLIAKIARLPLSWFSSSTSARVRKLVQDDAAQIHILVAHQPVDLSFALSLPCALIVYAFVMDWRLGLLSLATMPVYVMAMLIMMRDMGEKTVEMDQRLEILGSRAVEFVAGIAVVKAFGEVGRAHRSFSTAAKDFVTFYWAWCKPLFRGSALGKSSVSMALIVAVDALGGYALIRTTDHITVVHVLATIIIALTVPGALERLASNTWAYQVAGAAAMRITEVLDTPELDTPGLGTPAPDGGPGRDTTVVFDSVSFSYGTNQALSDVSLTLEPGTVTALLGASGSGKSTLATLLARFNDPDSGSITIGGRDLSTIPAEELYRTVSFVLQDPQLLTISVRDNIALGRPGATDDEIRAAAEAACIHDTILALPRGYDTIIGTDTALSGGQQQRIAIARALLIDAPILILDEATALTDPESEADIQRALNRLVVGRTVLVIAHRLESLRGADQLVVLAEGRVLRQGNSSVLDDVDSTAELADIWRGALPSAPHSNTLETTTDRESRHGR